MHSVQATVMIQPYMYSPQVRWMMRRCPMVLAKVRAILKIRCKNDITRHGQTVTPLIYKHVEIIGNSPGCIKRGGDISNVLSFTQIDNLKGGNGCLPQYCGLSKKR